MGTLKVDGHIKGNYIKANWLYTSAATAKTSADKICCIGSDNYIYYIAPSNMSVGSASKLATARTISLTGLVTGSGSFDGSGNLNIATTGSVASQSSNGFMSAGDKIRLDRLNAYSYKYLYSPEGSTGYIKFAIATNPHAWAYRTCTCILSNSYGSNQYSIILRICISTNSSTFSNIEYEQLAGKDMSSQLYYIVEDEMISFYIYKGTYEHPILTVLQNSSCDFDCGDENSLYTSITPTGTAGLNYLPISGGTISGLQVNNKFTLFNRDVTSTIYSQNASFLHYSTDASNGHWFNTTVQVKGNIYAGPDYSDLVLTSANYNSYALPIAGGYLYGNVNFAEITGGTSKKIVWSGSTDWAEIYYRVDASDAGRLVFNLCDDSNTKFCFAKNGVDVVTINADGIYEGTVWNSDISNKTYALLERNAAGITTACPTNSLVFDARVGKDTAGLFASDNNANAIITLNRHEGNYDTQLGFSSNGKLYCRTFNGSALNTTTGWNEIAYTSSTVSAARVVIAEYTGSGGGQGPSYIGKGKVRFNMMNKFPGWSSVNYMDCILMNTYAGSDVPRATALGIEKYTGRAWIAEGSESASTWDHLYQIWTTKQMNYGTTLPGSPNNGDIFFLYS